MHPILFQIGSFPVGTYGLILALGFLISLWFAKRSAREEGVDPEAIVDLAIVLLLAGILGSRLLMVIVDLIKGVPFSVVFDPALLRAGGHIHGGIIAGAIAFFWRMRKLKLNLPTTADILAPAIALGQGIGRLGCMAAGCCYGSECHLPWAVTFTNPDAHMMSGTPLGIPLHPVQLYTLLANLAVVAVLVVWRKRRAFVGQLAALYFMLEGVQRFAMEAFRDDPDRGTGWLGQAWLSTGRVTALGFIVFGIGLWVWFHLLKKRQPAVEA